MRAFLKQVVGCSLFAGAGMLTVTAPALAQSSNVGPAPSAALACLTVADGTPGLPDYPAALYDKKQGGAVEAQLQFRAPGEPPEVTLLSKTDHEELNAIIDNYARRFRVPCMQAAAGPVTLLQRYVFDPEGIARGQAEVMRDRDDAMRKELIKCHVHSEPNSEPNYPPSAQRSGVEGNVIVKQTFNGPTQAPVVEILSSPKSVNLRAAVERHAPGWRMPCLGDKPLEVVMVYKFILNDDGGSKLKDAPLTALLKGASGLQRPTYFNFDKMGCPFQLKLTYYRPFQENKVQQIGKIDPARRPLADWLRGLTLNLNTEMSGYAFGSTMKVEIPCGVMDL